MKYVHIKINGYYLIAYELVASGIKLKAHKEKKKAKSFSEANYEAMCKHVAGDSYYKIEKEDA